MEKVIITLRAAAADDAWCAALRTEVADDLLALNLPGLAVNVRDEPVRDSLMTLTTLDPPVVAFVSLWTQQSYGAQVEAVLTRLVSEHRLDGFEVDHQDHDLETRARLRRLADRLGVLGTGSSDYHGTGKVDHELGCNTTDPAAFERLLAAAGVAATAVVAP